LVGYTGTWILKGNDWRRLSVGVQPPPRMNSRMVQRCDGVVRWRCPQSLSC
jgi:hypothetical protein